MAGKIFWLIIMLALAGVVVVYVNNKIELFE